MTLLVAHLLTGVAFAGPTEAEANSAAPDDDPSENVTPEPSPKGGLTFLGLVQTRLTRSDIVTTNPFIDGQVVGTLGGTNGTTTSATERTVASEARTGGFFTYAPRALDGKASITAAFEVDFLYGDDSYGVGGNTGGAYGGDQVNLQTRRLHSTFSPDLGADDTLDVVVGLQFGADGVYNPATSALDDLVRGGGGLRFFGSEMAGISAYGVHRDGYGERLRYRLGAFTLYEDGASVKDDITLFMADAQVAPAYATRVGFHGWYLRDDAGGLGGIVGTGPSSILSELQGGPRLDYRADETAAYPEMDADLFWVGLDGSYNHRLDAGPLGVTGSIVANVGKLYLTGLPDAAVSGVLADGEVRYRYARGSGSVVRVEGLVSSADDVGPDYHGVITGNSYGVVGAVWSSHGALLLHPDVGAINRQVAVVSDVSNAGRGLRSLSATVGYDLVPHKLTVAGGTAMATDGAGEGLGTELNGRLSWRPLLLCNFGLAGATVLGSNLPETPWTVMTTLDWVLFG